jgi:hypothetical protein
LHHGHHSLLWLMPTIQRHVVADTSVVLWRPMAGTALLIVVVMAHFGHAVAKRATYKEKYNEDKEY